MFFADCRQRTMGGKGRGKSSGGLHHRPRLPSDFSNRQEERKSRGWNRAYSISERLDKEKKDEEKRKKAWMPWHHDSIRTPHLRTISSQTEDTKAKGKREKEFACANDFVLAQKKKGGENLTTDH